MFMLLCMPIKLFYIQLLPIYTVQPRLSGPQLSGTSIIRTLSSSANVHVRMRSGHDRLHLVGGAIAERRRWARLKLLEMTN